MLTMILKLISPLFRATKERGDNPDGYLEK
jgi:hypothetical protein